MTESYNSVLNFGWIVSSRCHARRQPSEKTDVPLSNRDAFGWCDRL